jgi:hypothetical protein
MITVDKVVKDNKQKAETVNDENEKLLNGVVKTKKRNYLPYIIVLAAAGGLLWWWLKKGKKENGTVSGQN